MKDNTTECQKVDQMDEKKESSTVVWTVEKKGV